MPLLEQDFRGPGNAAALVEAIRGLTAPDRPLRLMEICGTHTMAIAKAGLRTLLAPGVRLLSGPGCPVCVTPAGAIDAVLRLCEQPGVTVASYGDLLRVPGSVRGDTLLRRRALGASVLTVYSPMEAVEAAARDPAAQVVFLGVGFETTAPGTAACLLEAAERGLTNFSVLCLLKRTEPALRALLAAPDLAVDGFLCPGHVAAVTGARAFAFLPEEYGLPAVVSGFEAGDILYSVWRLARLHAEGRPALENEYTRVVRPAGNPAAQAAIDRVFVPADSVWRGLGEIPASGYALRPEFAPWDAAQKFGFAPGPGTEAPGCRCGAVLRGACEPRDCPLFGRTCTPADPVGPCMVSSEGACAAASRYGG
ncbi:MAG: hydrogenase formation protein HypD [Blautia massiliensis (ex Durand et al. 2017)]